MCLTIYLWQVGKELHDARVLQCDKKGFKNKKSKAVYPLAI